MTPIQDLREGILAGDWALVCAGYNAMTGDDLTPPARQEAAADLGGLRGALHACIDDFFPGPGDYPHDDPLKEHAVHEGARPTEESWRDREEAATAAALAGPASGDGPPDQSKRDGWRHEEPAAPEEDAVSARAREVRDAAARGRPAAESDLEKFRVENGKASAGGASKACRAEPYRPPSGNDFRDDRTLVTSELADSKKFSATKAPEPRRKKAQQVAVSCRDCGKKESVDPVFAPRSLDKGDVSNYVCNGCIRSKPRP